MHELVEMKSLLVGESRGGAVPPGDSGWQKMKDIYVSVKLSLTRIHPTGAATNP